MPAMPERTMPEIAAALFDLDDTLIDRRGAYDVFYRAFYDQHEAINDDISWPEAREFFWTLSPDNATNPRQAFGVIQERWPGVTGDPESHFHNYFKSMVANMEPLPGAMEFIEAMNASEFHGVSSRTVGNISMRRSNRPVLKRSCLS